MANPVSVYQLPLDRYGVEANPFIEDGPSVNTYRANIQALNNKLQDLSIRREALRLQILNIRSTYPGGQDINPELAGSLASTRELLDDLDEQARLTQETKARIEALKKAHATKLPIPDDRDHDVDVSYEELVVLIPQRIGGQPTNAPSFKELWDKLRAYGEDNYFSHENYKHILALISGEQYSYFQQLQEY